MNPWLYALGATRRRVVDAFSDPIRRCHIVGRIAEGYLGGLALVVFSVQTFLMSDGISWREILGDPSTVVVLLALPAIVPMIEYVVYEFVLEPWAKARVRRGKPSIVGPYWERSPQDGERFLYD